MQNISYDKIILLFILAVFSCSSAPRKSNTGQKKVQKFDKKIAQIYAKTYNHINWKEKNKIFINFRNSTINQTDDLLFRKGFADANTNVVLAVFRGIGARKIERYRNEYIKLLAHKNNIVRYKAYLQIANLKQEAQNLDLIKKGLKDEEWLVQEISLQIIRLHKTERESKKLYYDVLFLLNEKNPRVLRQVYRTLKWYRTSRVLPYLYKRSFIAQSPLEIVYIIRELASLKGTYHNRIKKRLIFLRDNYDNILVRDAARKALARRR